MQIPDLVVEGAGAQSLSSQQGSSLGGWGVGVLGVVAEPRESGSRSTSRAGNLPVPWPTLRIPADFPRAADFA
jgi:hypothetical protein